MYHTRHPAVSGVGISHPPEWLSFQDQSISGDKWNAYITMISA